MNTLIFWIKNSLNIILLLSFLQIKLKYIIFNLIFNVNRYEIIVGVIKFCETW